MDRQMVLVVYREYFEERLRELLDELQVDHFSQTPRVLGSGDAGKVEDSSVWPGHNRALFTVQEPDKAREIVTALRALVQEETERRHGDAVGFKVFILPCDIAL